MDSVISTILIVIVILAVIFLILREVMCWYWKINERIKLMEENNNLLKTLLLKSYPDNSNITKVLTTDRNDLSVSEKNTITVRHKVSKRVETVSLVYWEKMKDIYGEENYEIL